MFDLIVKGGTLPDGQVVDIGIKGSKITALADLSDAQAGQVIDASGDLVSPPFVDPISIWMQLCPTVYRASTRLVRCLRGSGFGVSSNKS